MGKILFTIALLAALAAPGLAQQDPDDPGMQDSLIIGGGDAGAHCPNFQTVNISVSAVTDDSINFYNLPIRAYAASAGISFGTPNEYFYPLTEWDVVYDSFFAVQDLLRQFGIAEISSDSIPKLMTEGTRQHVWTMRVIIAPEANDQLVVLDTCWDPINGSAMLGFDVVHELTPGIQRGYISIGENTPCDPQMADEGPVAPQTFSLFQNHPNPFNTSTTIEFALPCGGPVRLEVFDLLGRRVATLVEGMQQAGEHEAVWEATGEPSGVYFYRLSADELVETKRMLLLK